MDSSDFLDKIIKRKNGLANMKIVFVDIVKFSKRKTKIQTEIIKKFTELTQTALTTISQKYIGYTQQNNLNFSTDLIKIPTGDGILVAILFDGLERTHLDFSIELLKLICEYNNSCPCNRFDENGWCNCHQKFAVRIGIEEGQGIVFTDLNGNYNITGNVINMASRIMDTADESMILMGKTAYENLIDMTSDVSIEDDFRHYKQKVKHDILLDIYQYCPQQLQFVSKETPAVIQKLEQEAEVKQAFKEFTEDVYHSGPISKINMGELIEQMVRINEVQNNIENLSLALKGNFNDDIDPVDSLELLEMLRVFNPGKKKEVITIEKIDDKKE